MLLTATHPNKHHSALEGDGSSLAQRFVRIVLPAYNEEANLGKLLAQVKLFMEEERINYEVIVVDDGSSDRTAAIANDFASSMPIRLEQHSVNQGLGATIRDGLKLAASLSSSHDIIVAMDADNTHTPGLIPGMIALVKQGNDVVTASRYRPGSHVRGVPFHRLLLSVGARIVFQLVHPIQGVRDYTCGYRAYRASLLQEAFASYGDGFVGEKGFQCMVDILLKLHRMNAIFTEVPLILRYDLKGGVSKMRVASTVRRTLWLLILRRFGV